MSRGVIEAAKLVAGAVMVAAYAFGFIWAFAVLDYALGVD